MDAKLTLKLDQEIIEKAKMYAANKKISLSRLIENYLQSLTVVQAGENTMEVNISPFVKSLSSKVDIPVDYNYKKELGRYLEEKHQ